MALNNKEMAFDFVQRLLQEKLGGVFVRSSGGDFGRHCVFTWLRDTSVKFYVVYKREFFNSFGVWFPKFRGGVGESLNVEWLDFACRRGCLFVLFVYPDGRVFGVEPEFMRSYCVNNGLVREQGSVNPVFGSQGDLLSVKEVTYCVPIGVLRDFCGVLEGWFS